MSFKLMRAFRASVFGLFITYSMNPALAELCNAPTVTTATESCGDGTFSTFVQATNNCGCPVEVDAKLSNGGASILNVDGRKTKTDGISGCGYNKGEIVSYTYEFHCPSDQKDAAPKGRQQGTAPDLFIPAQ